MKPGRELDREVAEKVMGLREKLAEAKTQREYDSVRLHIEFCPEYSTDIASAWEVLNAFTQGKVNRAICHADVRFDADHCRWHAWLAWGKQRHSDIAETAPHVICLAALKAVGL